MASKGKKVLNLPNSKSAFGNGAVKAMDQTGDLGSVPALLFSRGGQALISPSA